ncbi:hypothetical protein C2G38_2169129 [Gigaspora rosea]|uniref:Uncharacterized protein n=1 Tax=Gigaspora rosea TaxID=44941 RepID=A0A397VNZ2_9GLOM|nr:hypothetical protein C2G38_2169129 [Gigaspora rosea]
MAQTSNIANLTSNVENGKAFIWKNIWKDLSFEKQCSKRNSDKNHQKLSLGGPNFTHAKLKHILFEDTTEEGGLKDSQISVLCARLKKSQKITKKAKRKLAEWNENSENSAKKKKEANEETKCSEDKLHLGTLVEARWIFIINRIV